MTNKEYLKQYRICKQRIEQAKETLRELEQGIDSISIDYSGMPHGSSIGSKTETYVIRLEEKREPILQQIAEDYVTMTEIAEAIRAIDSVTHAQLLYLRYVLGLSWLEVADAIGYDETYTCGTLHGRALQMIKQHN